MNRVLGFILVVLGFVISLLGWQVDRITGWLISYCGLAFLLVGCAYLGFVPNVYRKRTNGTFPVWNRLLLAPWLLLAEASFRLSILTLREVPFAQVERNLYFGRRLLRLEAMQGLAAGWIGILDLAGEFSEVTSLRECDRYQSLPILDATAPNLEQLHFAVTWLQDCTKRGSVYVHCALGHGRSATVIIAYLLATGSVRDYSEGIARLQTLRPGVKLNTTQIKSLQAWTEVLREMNAPPINP